MYMTDLTHYDPYDPCVTYVWLIHDQWLTHITHAWHIRSRLAYTWPDPYDQWMDETHGWPAHDPNDPCMSHCWSYMGHGHTWVMDGPYGSTWHVWVIHRPCIGHVGHTLVYGLCMGHTWVMYVMWVMYGSYMGHAWVTWVIHRSYMGHVCHYIGLHGSNWSCMGHTLVM